MRWEPEVDWHSLREIRPGTHVFSADNEQVGKFHEYTVDEETDEITRLVVNAGPFFPMIGFGAPKLIGVPVEQVREVTENRIALKCSKFTFDQLPRYADWAMGAGGAGDADGGFGKMSFAIKVPDREESEREIAVGARVMMHEPNVHIGDVEKVLVDQELEHVEALVIRVGLLFGHQVVLPIEYVTEFADDMVYVQMTGDEIKKLAKYED